MFQWMVYVVVVSLILSVAALCGERALRLRRATTRWVWATAIVSSLVVPTIIASVSIQVPNITAPSDPQKMIVLRQITTLPLTLVNEIPLLSAGANAGVSLDSQLERYWIIGSAAMMLLLAASAVQLFWRERSWSRATLGGASVYVAPGVGPAVVGLIRPRIVVPPWVVKSAPACQAHVIAHEQSHLAARDPLLLTTGLCLFRLHALESAAVVATSPPPPRHRSGLRRASVKRWARRDSLWRDAARSWAAALRVPRHGGRNV